jgi:hypothetical protein
MVDVSEDPTAGNSALQGKKLKKINDIAINKEKRVLFLKAP